METSLQARPDNRCGKRSFNNCFVEYKTWRRRECVSVFNSQFHGDNRLTVTARITIARNITVRISGTLNWVRTEYLPGSVRVHIVRHYSTAIMKREYGIFLQILGQRSVELSPISSENEKNLALFHKSHLLILPKLI
jgi:hypothetical protein